MERRQRSLRAAQRSGDLDEAARVRAHVRLRAGRQHVRRLAVAELARRLRLDDVVDPGGAAAEVLLGRLDDLEPGNPGERRPRGERQPLGVPQVARVLQREPQRERVARRRGRVSPGARRRRGPWRRKLRRARRPGASRAPSGASHSPTRSTTTSRRLEQRRRGAARTPCPPRAGRRGPRARRSSPGAVPRPRSRRLRGRVRWQRSRPGRRRSGRSR